MVVRRPTAGVHRRRRRRCRRLAEEVSVAGRRRGREPDAVAGLRPRRQLDGSGRAATRDLAAAAQPGDIGACRPRREAQSYEAGRRGGGLAPGEPREEHRGPQSDRPQRPAGSVARRRAVLSRLYGSRSAARPAARTTSGLAATQTAQKRIDDLEAQLGSDRALGYTDKHPDIDRLQREIKQARADLAASKVTQPVNRDETLMADPLYRQKLQERDMARIHVRELQLAATSAQRQIGDYQTRVETAPLAEQELASIDRDYKLELTRYNDLNTKYQQSRTAEDLARKQGGERFSVLYPATLPTTPIEPQPLKVMALAIAAGLMLGAGAAVGRELLDRPVHDSRALQHEFEVPVLGEISRILA